MLLYFGNLTENKFPDVMPILRYAYIHRDLNASRQCGCLLQYADSGGDVCNKLE